VFTYFVIWIEDQPALYRYAEQTIAELVLVMRIAVRKDGWRLYDNLEYWMTDFDRFSEAIRMKVERLSDGALHYDTGSFRVCCFTDCVNQVISRPGVVLVALEAED
jgi:hypothetical protein